jgi:hypothetical protein
MFFVYGISMSVAKKLARKKCRVTEGHGSNRREMTATEYEQKLAEMAQIIFEKMKPQKLSYSLSTPSLCKQYIELAKRQEPHKELHIRYRKPSGSVNPKTKKEVFCWEVYRGGSI